MADEPFSHRFASQRLDLHYVDWGNRDAPTVILVHGGRDHARNWDRVARALRDDWHVVAPDLRGHGDSGWSTEGVSAIPYFMTDLAQLIDVLGQREVRIVSHSFGGAIALHYAGCFPERVARIAAIEGLRPLAPDESADARALRRWVERRTAGLEVRTLPTLAEAAARMRAHNPRLSAPLAEHLAAHAVNPAVGGFRWKFDPTMAWPPGLELPLAMVHELWGAIACPVWLVHGQESWAGNPAEDGRAALFRDARVTSYEGAGHWAHHDRPDDFIADLKAFLA